MKLVKIIGLIFLICITFFYTDKVIDVAINQDEIMINIKEEAEKEYQKPTNAIITDDTIIPGNVGKDIWTRNQRDALLTALGAEGIKQLLASAEGRAFLAQIGYYNE